MLERLTAGAIPSKPHTALRSDQGNLRYEECLTRAGFEGPFTILYHLQRPHESRPVSLERRFRSAEAVSGNPLLRRHFRTLDMQRGKGNSFETRAPLLFNEDLALTLVTPDADDGVYLVNSDADTLFFVFEGGGTLRTPLGDLAFTAHDYVYVPKGLLYRHVLNPSERQTWLGIDCFGGLGLPRQYRNDVGQLVMGAPYSHRDFKHPDFRGPLDEGLRELVVRRGGALHSYVLPHSPLDVVGWDGTVYPFVFPIERFQPRVGLVHLPPTVHGTFVTRGALICSFVPRPLDFHPDAVPCPYPHNSVDIDEVLFYVAGSFTSRRGVGAGSISLHPAGIPHGPHPDAYESSIGAKHTDELAVMLDCARPLNVTRDAVAVEDSEYHASFDSENAAP